MDHWGGKDGSSRVEAGMAFSVYSLETVTPGSHSGSSISQPALTFRYHAQLGQVNKHNCRFGHVDSKAGPLNHHKLKWHQVPLSLAVKDKLKLDLTEKYGA